jgi:hypothetical protein
MTNGIREYYAARKGNSNGIPVVHVIIDIAGASYLAQTDAYLPPRGVRICGNDWSRTLRNTFAPPGGTNGSDPRPVYIIINGVSNSTSHAQWQLLELHIEPGGGAEDYTARIAAWRNIIDSVQAPPPRLTNTRLTNDTFQFTFPGQRGRTNRVECTTNFIDWTTVTNTFGTNAPITFRDTNAAVNPQRVYRVRRL